MLWCQELGSRNLYSAPILEFLPKLIEKLSVQDELVHHGWFVVCIARTPRGPTHATRIMTSATTLTQTIALHSRSLAQVLRV